jgi:hypothetical protein
VQPFTFDRGFQRAILRLMMVDDSFAARAFQWIGAEMFTAESFGWMFGVFREHWQTWSMRTTDLVLREAVRQLSQEKAMRFSSEVEQVIALGAVPEGEWVKSQLAEFIKQAIFARAHRESVKPFNDGRTDRAYSIMAAAMERIQEVDFDKVDRVWLFDELDERQRERVRHAMNPMADRFTTGIQQLDSATEGGVHRGELWAVFAYAKRCKTTWLVNQGFNATRIHRRPTLHLLLEGRIDLVAARYDACFSGELYNRVKRGEIDAALYYELQQEYLQLRRLLVIRRLPGWDNTIDDVRAELHFLRSQGFIPEMMITDYMDLGRKRDADRSDSELKHQVGFARDLKRLHENENMAGWSAWQATRPRKGAHTRAHVLTSSNVADAYAKVRVVTAYGSLNATDDEMDDGEMRFFMEGHRDAAVNRLWTIENDLSRMKMALSVIHTPEADPTEATA